MLTLLTRTGDRATNQSALQEMGRTSSKIEEATRKITTGRAVDTFKDAGGYATRILELETRLSGFEDYEQGETTVKTRLSNMEVVVRQINDIATDFRARLAGSTSYGVEDNVFQEYCATQLKEVERLLNTKDAEGRYLFGGENTLSEPVDVSLVAPPAIGAPLSFAYYKGTDSAPQAIIGEGQAISYGVTAKSDAFAQLINALAVGAANAPSHDSSTLQYQMLTQNAMPMMERATTEIPDVIQDIGGKMKTVEQSSERQEAIKLYTKDLLSDLTDANYVDSVIEMHMASSALQFSMLAHQQLSENLNDLLDALRAMR